MHMKISEAMKKIIKRCIYVVVFISITCCILITLNTITLTKDRYYKVREDFLSMEQDTMDVMILGSCHAYTSINPMRMWYQSGITAYNYSLPSSILPTTYMQLVETLDNQKPEVVFIEAWGLNSENTYISYEDLYNYFIELTSHFPYSDTKKMVVDDFFNAEINPIIADLGLSDEDLQKDKSAIMWPFMRYKNRILGENGLSEIDFNEQYEYTEEDLKEVYFNREVETRIRNKGFLENAPVDDVFDKGYKPMTSTGLKDISEINQLYLDKIINLCEEKGAQVVFFTSPYMMSEEEVQKFNTLNTYLSERGVPYLYMPKLVNYDYQNDFNDRFHLDYKGAIKQTDYIINYLKKNYKLPDHRGLELPDWPDVFTEGS